MHSLDASMLRSREKELDKHFAADWRIRSVPRSLQRHGIDRIWTHRASGREWTVEYKCDGRAVETGNAFIETVSVDTAGKLGWAYTSWAQQLVYYCPGLDFALVVPMNALKTRLVAWRRDYRERGPVKNMGRDGKVYGTFGLAVPLDEMRAIASASVSVEILDEAPIGSEAEALALARTIALDASDLEEIEALAQGRRAS